MKQNKNFTGIFRSTTLRLTGWYLLVLMILSISFSFVIYRVASDEIDLRLEHLQMSLQQSRDIEVTPIRMMDSLRTTEVKTADENLSVQLIYVNIFVLFIGGFISYFLARRSLIPIEKAHEAQSRFTSDASHELRTPLAVMKTELEVALRDDSSTTESLKEVLNSNLEEVEKLSKLSEMLLSLSRIESSSLKLSPINLTKVTRETIKRYGKLSDRITVESEKQQIVHGNETAIADVIKILVDNALQYSPAESAVKINISQHNQSVIFEISNTGTGIKPDKLPCIFDRFYRADSSRTSGNNAGFGLGLAIAKNIIDLHHGTISATSKPNELTTFVFSLPHGLEEKPE